MPKLLKDIFEICWHAREVFRAWRRGPIPPPAPLTAKEQRMQGYFDEGMSKNEAAMEDLKWVRENDIESPTFLRPDQFKPTRLSGDNNIAIGYGCQAHDPTAWEREITATYGTAQTRKVKGKAKHKEV